MDDIEYYESSEAMAIEGKAVQEFRELLRKDFKVWYDDIEEKQKYWAQRNELLSKRERDIEQKEKDLAEREEKLYEEFKKKWFDKTLGLNIKPGDRVYYVQRFYESIACPVCGGAGKITGITTRGNEELTCPECRGNKKASKASFSVKEGVAAYFKTYLIRGKEKVWTGSVDADMASYCYSTAVELDDGVTWRKIEDIYLTREEAEEMAKRYSEGGD